ncbi:hypothetical protein EYR41_000509 [Orbilia oligospora]|uniref:Uncharacterized protein n=1 Tax=Orbilia oligospora TaxID=2813651 RepID=A0A7C8K2F7_ORBOL|nr:hypothetical protein TWF751_011165 [Orbilia oligospora]TGJ73412.1 hypothetical protein EYR41_000509 [Orbilia oligospora]
MMPSTEDQPSYVVQHPTQYRYQRSYNVDPNQRQSWDEGIHMPQRNTPYFNPAYGLSVAGPSQPNSGLNSVSSPPMRNNSMDIPAQSHEYSELMGQVEPTPRAGHREPRCALSFNVHKRSWNPCLRTSAKEALVDLPQGYPEFEWLRDDNARHLMMSTGKLFNTQEFITQSGFWVEGGYFITTLHFGSWMKSGEQPIQQTLELYRGRRDYGFAVSTMYCNTTGIYEDDNFVRVYLMKWNLENDLAVFAPIVKNRDQTAPSMIPTGCIVESDALFQYFDRLNGVDMFAVGYNNLPDLDIASYLSEFAAEVPSINGTAIDYSSMIRPNFKSVAVGSIRDIDPVRSELMVDCTAWKGFFGGLIAIRYQHSQSNIQPLVIGHIVSARGNERFNRARFIPAGLREYLKQVNPFQIGHEPGELGFPRVSIATIPLPMEIARFPNGYIRHHAPSFAMPRHPYRRGPQRHLGSLHRFTSS